jgi:hypothetical protein
MPGAGHAPALSAASVLFRNLDQGLPPVLPKSDLVAYWQGPASIPERLLESLHESFHLRSGAPAEKALRSRPLGHLSG